MILPMKKLAKPVKVAFGISLFLLLLGILIEKVKSTA